MLPGISPRIIHPGLGRVLEEKENFRKKNDNKTMQRVRRSVHPG